MTITVISVMINSIIPTYLTLIIQLCRCNIQLLVLFFEFGKLCFQSCLFQFGIVQQCFQILMIRLENFVVSQELTVGVSKPGIKRHHKRIYADRRKYTHVSEGMWVMTLLSSMGQLSATPQNPYNCFLLSHTVGKSPESNFPRHAFKPTTLGSPYG